MSGAGAESAGPWRLCHVDDIDDPGAKGFERGWKRIFAVRKDGAVHVYLNACPHRFSPLEMEPDRFLTAERDLILCTTHGALFRIEDGVCVSGPCKGGALSKVAFEIKDGEVIAFG